MLELGKEEVKGGAVEDWIILDCNIYDDDDDKTLIMEKYQLYRDELAVIYLKRGYFCTLL